jgi:prepilin-type N-terminal cleavage/methylation domain-containing protein
MSRSQKGTRGMTLIELMLSMAIMSGVLIGLTQFIITTTKQNRVNFERSDLVRSGRTALSIMTEEIENAGMGLPRRLAIRSWAPAGSGSVDSCASTPEIEIAWLDLARQWTVQSSASGTITLDPMVSASADPSDDNPTGAADSAITAGEWLFLYKNATFDTAGGNHGHGMVLLSANRAVAATALSVANDPYSSSQASFDLDQPIFVNGTGHDTVVLRARTSRFGVNCDDVTRPYLYWARNGQSIVPLASGADTDPLTVANSAIDAGVTDVVALRFRFMVDEDNDGQTDGTDFVDPPTDATALALFLSNVTAVEVLFRLRASAPDPNTNVTRRQDFARLVRTANINTRSSDYIFVDNTGL